MRKWAAFLCILFVLLAAGCTSEKAKKVDNDDRIVVVTSFNAMKELTQAVGGKYIRLETLVPDGTGPHGFQPTSDQMKMVHRAKVLVVHGLGMEPWTQDVVKAADNPELVVVEASRGVDAIPLADAEEIKEHGAYDPHAWMSLKAAQIEVQNIASALIKADPVHKEIYRQQAEAYNRNLEALYQEYKKRMAQLPGREFVTGHAAFGYLCRDFDLKMNSIESVFAEGEPSAKQLVRLLDYCKAHHIRTIFTESGVNPKTSLTLAREIGAETVPIYTLETAENGKDYLTRMRENLEQIYEHLK
jgi:zinc transport system substrate-binding protein